MMRLRFSGALLGWADSGSSAMAVQSTGAADGGLETQQLLPGDASVRALRRPLGARSAEPVPIQPQPCALDCPPTIQTIAHQHARNLESAIIGALDAQLNGVRPAVQGYAQPAPGTDGPKRPATVGPSSGLGRACRAM